MLPRDSLNFYLVLAFPPKPERPTRTQRLGVQEEDILPAVRRLFHRWQRASGDLRTPQEQERQRDSRREHTPRKGQEGQKEERRERERESRCVPA